MRISEFIRTHAELSQLDFATVYFTIITLLNEGYLAQSVDVVQPKSER